MMTMTAIKKAVTMLTAAVVTMSASGLFTSAIAAPVGATNSVGEAAAQTAELDKVLTGTGGAEGLLARDGAVAAVDGTATAKAQVAATATVADMRKIVSAGKEDAGNPSNITKSAGNPYTVTMDITYNAINSIDGGKLYLKPASGHPGVTTVMNDDGSISIGAVAKDAREFYVYEYSKDLAHKKTMKFNYELEKFGAFAKDKEGNYYIFSAKDVAEGAFDEINMALVKYNSNGEKISFYYSPARRDSLRNMTIGVKVPFRSSGCRLEISGDMIAVHFARLMFVHSDGLNHQGTFGFVLDKNNIEKNNIENYSEMLNTPYVSHSFNQYILPIENGFVLVNQGDAYPHRGFMFSKMQKRMNDSYHFIMDGKNLTAVNFKGAKGDNRTFAQMGGLAKASSGYIFVGTYEKNTVVSEAHNDSRNLFVLTIDDGLNSSSEPIWITDYNDKEMLNAANPKIAALNSGRYLLMWELMTKDSYVATYMAIIDETGKTLTPIRKVDNVRLNINDPLRYNKQNGHVYWAVGANSEIDVFAFNPDKPFEESAKFTGEGTAQSPYQISTAADIALLAKLIKNGRIDYKDKHYILTGDINLNFAPYNQREGWMPIGISGAPFCGTFDGNGKTVSGLMINRPTVDNIGLFGCITGGNVKNLGLIGADIKGKRGVGGIAGWISGSAISNCYAAGDISGGSDRIGGIVGRAENNSTISNCYAAGNVSGGSVSIGGIAGRVDNSEISNCAALNQSVIGSGDTKTGRVVGSGGKLAGNLAWDGIKLPPQIKVVSRAAGVHGESVTTAQINADGALGGRFTAPVWTTAPGKLPGFGKPADMPDHIKYGTAAAQAQVAAAAQKTVVADAAAGKSGDDSNTDDFPDEGPGVDPNDITDPTPASVISSAGKVVVGPLLKTDWGSGSPFSPFHATLPDGRSGWVGCSKVAVGQIMKYHKYPKRGNGQSKPYNVNGIDFPSVSFEVDYDWNNMLDTYKNINITEQQRNEICTLMYHLFLLRSEGYANTYFYRYGFDKSFQWLTRKYYDDSTWAAIIREQLDLRLPIFISNGRHAFVIDGYDSKGRFHVNWGWGGKSDGYYPLDSLSPGSKGFDSKNVKIFINLQPDKGSIGSQEMALDMFAVEKNSVGQYELFNISTRIHSFGFFPGGQVGTALVDNKGDIVKVIGIKNFGAKNPNGARDYKMDVFLQDDVSPGQYTLRIVTRFEGGEWKLVTLSDRTASIPNAINFTVKPAEPGASGGGYGLALTMFSSEKNAVSKNEQFSISVKLKNVGSEQFPGESQYGAALIDNGGNIVEVIGSKRMVGAIRAGGGWSNPSTAVCTVPATVPAGQYRLRVVIKANGKDEWRVATMSPNDTPTAINFTVKPAEPGASGGGYGLALTMFSSEKDAVSKNEQFKVTVTLKNIGVEQFPGGESQFGAALTDEGGNMVEIIGTTKMIGAIDAEGKLGRKITCKVPNTVSPGQYRLRVVIKPDGKDEWRVATMGLNGTPNAIGFTVNR